MMKSNYLYCGFLTSLLFVSTVTQAVTIDRFTTDFEVVHSECASMTSLMSQVVIEGAHFKRTITGKYNPSVIKVSGPDFTISSSDPKVQLLLGGSPALMKKGGSAMGGSYILSEEPLVLKYSYGDATSVSFSILYEGVDASDFINLNKTPLVRAAVEGFGSLNVSATKSTLPFVHCLPSCVYEMTFSDGTHKGTVKGIHIDGVMEFDASKLDEVDLGHIVRMKLVERSTGNTEVTFTLRKIETGNPSDVKSCNVGNIGDSDTVKLLSNVYTTVDYIETVSK